MYNRLDDSLSLDRPSKRRRIEPADTSIYAPPSSQDAKLKAKATAGESYANMNDYTMDIGSTSAPCSICKQPINTRPGVAFACPSCQNVCCPRCTAYCDATLSVDLPPTPPLLPDSQSPSPSFTPNRYSTPEPLDSHLLRDRLSAVAAAAVASLSALPTATQTTRDDHPAQVPQAAQAAQPLRPIPIRMGMGMVMDVDIDMDMDSNSNENPTHDQSGLTGRSLSQHVLAFNQPTTSIEFMQPPSFNSSINGSIHIDTNTNTNAYANASIHANTQHQHLDQHSLQHYSSTSSNSSFMTSAQELEITSRPTNVNEITSLNRALDLSRLFGGSTIEKKRKRSLCSVTEKVSTALSFPGVFSTNQRNQNRQQQGVRENSQSEDISETSIPGYQPVYSAGCCSKRCIDCLVDTSDGHKICISCLEDTL